MNNTNPKKNKRSAVFFSTIVVALAMMMGFGGCANLNDPSDWDNWEMEEKSNIEQVEDKKEENSNVENDVVVPSNGGFNVIKTSTNNDSSSESDARIAELEDKVASLTSELEGATSTINGLTSENNILSNQNAEKDKVIAAQKDALKEATNPFTFDENGNLTCDFEYAEKAARRQNADGTWYYLVQAGKKLITTDVRSCADYRPEYMDNHFEAARNGYQIIGKAGSSYGIYSIVCGGVAYVGKANVNGYALVDTTKQNGRGGDFAAIFHNSFVYIEDPDAEYGYSVYLAGDYVAPKPSNDSKKDDNKKDNTIVIKETEKLCFICGLDKDHCPGHTTEKTITKTVTETVEKEICFICGRDKDHCPGHVTTKTVEVPGDTKYIYVPVPTPADNTPDNNPNRDDDADFDNGPADMNPDNNPNRDDDDFDSDDGPADMGDNKDDGPADMGDNKDDGPADMNPENNPVEDDDFGFNNNNGEGPSDMNSAVSNNGDDFGGANDEGPSDMNNTIVSSVVEIENNDAPQNSYASGDDQF